MTELRFSSRILGRFVETLNAELGEDQFRATLALSSLPLEWATPASLQNMDGARAAEIYAALQSALRTYYGRGARGVLLRVGQRLWHFLLEDAALHGKVRAAWVRRLPLATQRKSILDLLAGLIATRPEDITVHTLDLDLMVVDHVSPTADGQTAPHPICFVTQGLIRESLLWATGQGFDVEEESCKALGHDTCEFKITTGRLA